MSSKHAPVTAFWVEEDYDREYASDGRSRYGAYLAMHTREFTDTDVDAPTADPRLFAAAAFTIACAPIMAPGYVRRHPRVHGLSWCWDDEQRVAFEVGLVAPLPEPIAKLLSGRGWDGWQRYRQTWWEPDANDRPGAYTVVTVRVPLPAELVPTPAYTRAGLPELHTARHAVRAVCRQLYGHLDSIITAAGV
jgi:hypothetical protein